MLLCSEECEERSVASEGQRGGYQGPGAGVAGPVVGEAVLGRCSVPPAHRTAQSPRPEAQPAPRAGPSLGSTRVSPPRPLRLRSELTSGSY